MALFETNSKPDECSEMWTGEREFVFVFAASHDWRTLVHDIDLTYAMLSFFPWLRGKPGIPRTAKERRAMDRRSPCVDLLCERVCRRR